jgi:hypothetical protein
VAQRAHRGPAGPGRRRALVSPAALSLLTTTNPDRRAEVDSLERGWWLDNDLLPRTAAQGAELVATYTPWAGQMEVIRRWGKPPASGSLTGMPGSARIRSRRTWPG